MHIIQPPLFDFEAFIAGTSRETSKILRSQIRKIFQLDVRQIRVIRVSREPQQTRITIS